MNIAIELFRFKAAHGKGRIVDFSGDKTRFFNLHTARAWAAWLAKKANSQQ